MIHYYMYIGHFWTKPSKVSKHYLYLYQYVEDTTLPKYIYLSPALIFPTTYNGIRTKNRPV
jgi:hypothetical protein